MKLSEFIEKLEQLRAEIGNVEVCVYDDGEYYPAEIETINNAYAVAHNCYIEKTSKDSKPIVYMS